MQIPLVTDPQRLLSVASASFAEVSAANQSAFPDYRMIHRNRDKADLKPHVVTIPLTSIAGAPISVAASLGVRCGGFNEAPVAALRQHQCSHGTCELELANDIGMERKHTWVG